MELYRALSEHMAGDHFHVIRGPLTFSSEKVEITAVPGTKTEGSFTVYGTHGCPAEGFVRSSLLTMHLTVSEFSGSSDIITFVFDAGAYRAGDEAEGFFRIISNQGEYQLPFIVHIAEEVIETTAGAVRNPAGFAALARMSWEEAVNAFYDPRFEGIFGAEDKDALSLWRGLKGEKGSEHNVEEFLIATGRKSPAEFLSEVRAIRTELPEEEENSVVEYYFRLTRNGWGLTELTVDTAGDFLHAVKHYLTRNDFSGNVCEIHYLVDRRKLHDGINPGEIRISGAHTDLRIPVSVSASRSSVRSGYLCRKEMSELTVKLMKLYERYRAKRMKGRDFLTQAEVLIDRMQALSPEDTTVLLYKIHAAISSGKQKEAAWMLMDFDRKTEERLSLPAYSDPDFRGLERSDPQLFAYRVYLGALCADAENVLGIYDAVERVEGALRRQPDSWQTAWILIYLSEEYRTDPVLRWNLLRDICERGKHSPVLYIEAYSIIEANPSMLAELDEFSLQVLNFASRRNLIGDAVQTQINNLTMRRKTYSAILFRILSRSYDRNILREETLLAVCSLLIRGGLTSPEYFVWYERGVEAQLNLTRLLEFYMLSLPEDYSGEIPKFVLLYFCYQSSLPYEKTAQLYEYVQRNRQRFPSLYDNYRSSILEFTSGELTSGHVSPSLCYLYSALIDRDMLSRENAAAAADAVFTCRVHTDEERFSAVILRYDDLSEEYRYYLEDGTAWFPVYGDRNRIFFEDGSGRRYASGVGYTYERMISCEGFVPLLERYDTGNVLFDLFLSGRESGVGITGENCERYRALAVRPGLSETTGSGLKLKLLRYYNENGLFDELDACLAELGDGIGIDALSRGEIIGILTSRGMYDRALGWIGRCGTYGVPVSALLELGSSAQASGRRDEEILTAVSFDAWKGGRVNERILQRLCDSFDGLTVELDELLNAVGQWQQEQCEDRENTGESDTDPETGEVSGSVREQNRRGLLDRLFGQMLYSGVILRNEESVLELYRETGGDPERCSAVVAQLSHYSFVDDVPFTQAFFGRIAALASEGTPVYDISRMAYLRNLSRKQGELGGEELETAKLFLKELLGQGIVFPFYRSFSGLLPELQAFADETMIQYKGRPGSSVLVHYSVDDTSDVQPMKEMYEGIYVAEFLLFFGEQVRYYITDDPEQKNVVESGTFSQDTRISGAGSDRFAVINRISMLSAVGKYAEAITEMEDYNRRAHMAEALFGKKPE